MNPKVDFYFDKNEKWHHELVLLRPLVLACGLNEELKWGCPCYTLGKANIVLIHVFKEYCALLFFKGALITDTHNMLIQQTENVQAARQIRFTNAAQISQNMAILNAYIYQAIEIEKTGVKVQLKKTREFAIPEEFQTKLDANTQLAKAFEELTPGRQRAYLLHFASAKQTKTRQARIEKFIPQIFEGKGLDD